MRRVSYPWWPSTSATTMRSAGRTRLFRGRLGHMKEDVLEQVVDDYLKFKGYFTIHNVGFRPRANHPDYVAAQDSVRSDVDVVGYHPRRSGLDRVMVVSCKAWQSGFDANAKLAELRGEKKNPKRATWQQ